MKIYGLWNGLRWLKRTTGEVIASENRRLVAADRHEVHDPLRYEICEIGKDGLPAGRSA